MKLKVEPLYTYFITKRESCFEFMYCTDRVQTHEFHNFVQVMFRPIFRTDKKYVECIYTSLIT